MKNIVLAGMTATMIATSAGAMSPDLGGDFNLPVIVDHIVESADPVGDWDYFWGTTLNPANTGWNDFWYQCQDPNKTVGDCIGTVAAGIGGAVVAPWLVVSAVVVGVAAIPVSTTVMGMTMMPTVAAAGF